MHPVLINGQWRPAYASGSFCAENPATGRLLPDEFPISTWADCDLALNAAAGAALILAVTPPKQLADFLTLFAARIEAQSNELVEIAHLETALPQSPRLADVEIPRTTNQLRQAAAAALDGAWAMPVVDAKTNIRSLHAPIGPVLVFGPNNFPFAYNGVCGGDFAAAVAVGNPVIAKAHPLHPRTTELLAREALAAVKETGLPPATLQLIYNISSEDGLRMAADPRLGAVGFTGSRAAGLKLKAAADAVGKPIYLELSSVNPVVILPGALAERWEIIADDFGTSCLAASGQFCTNPGLIFLTASVTTEKFIAAAVEKFSQTPVVSLLSSGVAHNLHESVAQWQQAGAQLLVGGQALPRPAANRFANTLLRASGSQFLAAPEPLQTEAFGNASLLIVATDTAQLIEILSHLHGNLTGSIYSAANGSEDEIYNRVAARLRPRVGRLLNDKMPTGVAVVPAMNHGGPFPATGHPGFTAVGIPAAMRRFTMLQCFDQVRMHRLPLPLQENH